MRSSTFSLLAAALVLAPMPAAAQTPMPAPPVIDGEVLIVQGTADVLEPDRMSYRLKTLAPVAKQVIAKLGDNFHTITVWLTFDDGGDLSGAYSFPIKSDVRGLGLRLDDKTAMYGSAGVLHTVINMKGFGLRAGDTLEEWIKSRTLSVWGQEYSHRWAMFLTIRDPRTGALGELLLGRDCSHYNRFVETQGSVLDGYAWKDNGDGSFTWSERAVRFSHLDLYTMGLLRADEVPPFFLIDGIPGYTQGRCGAEYASMPFPSAMTIKGTRVDLTMEDVVFGNGHRAPSADEPQDRFREAIVVLTGLAETPDSPRPRQLAARLNRGRPWWDDWLRTATRGRLNNCTTITAECGDPRADVTALEVDPAGWKPSSPVVSVGASVKNGGTADAPAAKLVLEALAGGKAVASEERALGAIGRGGELKATAALRLAGPACGAEVLVRASTQTDLHFSRREQRVVLGTETRAFEDLEADTGWTVNPDGNDSAAAGAWERASPERAELRARFVQPAGAHGGRLAFVTGAAGGGSEDKAFVSHGRTTLQSPPLPLPAPSARPQLRYWVSFAGGHMGSSSLRLDPSPLTRLGVLARAVGESGDPLGDFVMVDEIKGTLTSGWTSRLVSLEGKLPVAAARVQLRFVASDEEPADGAVEAAIDDVELLALRAECLPRPDAAAPGKPAPDAGAGAPVTGGGAAAPGCACAVGSSSRRGPGAAALLIVAALFRRRRAGLRR
jgi:MYXO-CTERM domain-containing protein